MSRVLHQCFKVTFSFSGRTEYQTATVSRARRSVRFERKPSHRYSRRATFERAEREEKMKLAQERADRKKAAQQSREAIRAEKKETTIDEPKVTTAVLSPAAAAAAAAPTVTVDVADGPANTSALDRLDTLIKGTAADTSMNSLNRKPKSPRPSTSSSAANNVSIQGLFNLGILTLEMSSGKTQAYCQFNVNIVCGLDL